MSDVFISYSRKDGDFVRRLHDALKTQQRDTWVDWEDIPLTAEWWEEIKTAIEAADTFVFVISPDSARSKVCFDEVEHAHQNNKRIVPVLYREVTDEPDRQRVHPAINRHNWIFIRETDDFDAALAGLVTAIDTDLAYVHTHTRLLIRAKEWDRIGRKASPLLRGSDLRQAEAWLASSGSKGPKPTELHAEYIMASRRASTRFQRTVLVSVSIALMITLFLLGLAVIFFQQARANLKTSHERGTEVAYQAGTALAAQNTSVFNEGLAQTQAAVAEGERATAVYQGGVSQSVALAAQVQPELQGRYPERGVLLALEALESYPYTWQAERALGEAVQNSRIHLILDHPDSVLDAAWSPDGARIATVGRNNIVTVWNTSSGDRMEMSGEFPEASSLAWDADGILIAVSGGESVSIVNSATGEILITLSGSNAAWSPDGKYLVVVTPLGDVEIYDADFRDSTPLEVWGVSLVMKAAWSPDSTQLVTANNDKTIRIWRGLSGEELLSFIGHTSTVNSVQWSPSGQYILTSSSDYSAAVWDIATAGRRLSLMGHTDMVYDAAWSPDEKLIATTSQDGTVKIWDATTGDLVFTFTGHSASVHSVTWSPDGVFLATASADRTVKVWRVELENALLTFAGHRSAVASVAWSPDGAEVLTAGWDRNAKVWSPTTGDELVAFDCCSGPARSAAWSSDGTQVAVAGGSEGLGVVQVWDVSARAILRVFEGHQNVVSSVDWSPNGERIVTASWDGTARVWDIKTGDEWLAFADHTNWVMDAAWSPDGRRIVTTSRDRTAKVWSAESGEIQCTFGQHTDTVLAAAWSPNGENVVTVSNDGTARVWKALTCEQLLVLSGHGAVVYQAVWSPDGQRIATSSYDRTVKVWDAQTGYMLLTLVGHRDVVYSVSWSPNGNTLATASRDGTAKIWPAFQTTGVGLIRFSGGKTVGGLH